MTTLDAICELCPKLRFHGTREVLLQDALGQLLRATFSEVDREVPLTKSAVVDFLVGDVAIEVKIDESPMAVTRQLRRYAESPRVQSLVLVTTRAKHRRCGSRCRVSAM
ncbi:hypothetical protein LCGC14_2646250 [marine sediment metagenome]|uniref:Type I restriction enzyme R protein N-terminal domain-containing protein n=1 Tax=marine sediment metagenome TaxID=412755 RepID=A0A0F8ZW75_9ZZZZ